MLKASFLVFLLPPHHSNFNKRLIKSPKLYFYDTGLVCYLLGIREAGQLEGHPLRGALFEGYVVGEVAKAYWSHRRSPPSSTGDGRLRAFGRGDPPVVCGLIRSAGAADLPRRESSGQDSSWWMPRAPSGPVFPPAVFAEPTFFYCARLHG